MSAHTAGPWRAESPQTGRDSGVVVTCRGSIIAEAWPSDNQIENAALIARAPELLAEVARLRAVLSELEFRSEAVDIPVGAAGDMFRASLAKARAALGVQS